MKIYQVGGSIRDELMGLEPRDRDFVVVGSSPEEMISLGFTSVGKDFPVFIHPNTKEEYALARREKKNGIGYSSFEFETNEVSLEEDLYRRDLTINAMAKDEKGEIIDPFGGQKDLEKKVLRHVSIHFCEDPLRVLRVARFQSRYPDFSVDEETKKMMKRLIKTEIASLSVDRFYKEISKILQEKSPDRAFALLNEVGFFKEYLHQFIWQEPSFWINEKVSNEAKMVFFAQLQVNPGLALIEIREKLGFKSSLLKQINDLANLLNLNNFTDDMVVSSMLKTKAHQRKELYNKAIEVLQLQHKSLNFALEILKAAEVYVGLDCSFVKQLDVKDRARAVKNQILKEYLKIKN